ncbi:hypothetical protein MPTK1_4g06680 [Marchantia polymorpha subsp. ruderalis]|uniref:Uncharacterized protein n=4 Tax=Marchantia polymorpha TaxID=3197 RepID=A0AAF6B744_MARPO|nr:hypothetical protein MARPO_0125s0013 [Marchantia polymorpha]BBN07828.1 hypothetical protein Mp_4g06680 [Marchantia polymorpha subsp. ruderalis]|eukprot:PTQ30362.1 hypothetical protein MARPO_0125s0013 [Marchantia polymorpha]
MFRGFKVVNAREVHYSGLPPKVPNTESGGIRSMIGVGCQSPDHAGQLRFRKGIVGLHRTNVDRFCSRACEVRQDLTSRPAKRTTKLFRDSETANIFVGHSCPFCKQIEYLEVQLSTSSQIEAAFHPWD